MDIKNVKINLRLSDEQKRMLPDKILKSKRLIFIVCVGAYLVYAFNIVYKKAYVEVNFIEYAAGSSLVDTHEGIVTLEEIMSNLEMKKSNRENAGDEEFDDPFEYQNMEKEIVPATGGQTTAEGARSAIKE